jgi:hypothetical protein
MTRKLLLALATALALSAFSSQCPASDVDGRDLSPETQTVAFQYEPGDICWYVAYVQWGGTHTRVNYTGPYTLGQAYAVARALASRGYQVDIVRRH